MGEIRDELRRDREARKEAVERSLAWQRLALRRQMAGLIGVTVAVLAALLYLSRLRD